MSKKPPQNSTQGGSPKPPKITVAKPQDFAGKDNTSPSSKRPKRGGKQATKKAPKKPSRWKQRLVWGLLIIAGLFVILNGIGARYIGQRFLDQALIDAKIDGHATIQGDILNGLYLENIAFKDLGALKHLTAKKIAFNYDFEDLKNKRIDSIKATGLTVLLDLTPSPDEEPTPFTFDKLRLPTAILEQLSKHLTPLGVEIAQTDLTFIFDERVFWHGRNCHLTHLAGDQSLTLTIESITDLEGVTFQPPPTNLSYTDSSLTIGKLPLTHSAQVALQSNLSSTQEGPSDLPKTETSPAPVSPTLERTTLDQYLLTLHIDNSQISVRTDDYQDLHLDFSGEPLTSAQLPADLNIPPDIKFNLTELSGSISNLSLTPQEWLGDFRLKSTRLQVKERNLPTPLCLEIKRSNLQRILLSADLSNEAHPNTLHGSVDFSDPTTEPRFWEDGIAKLHLQGQSVKWILKELNIKAPSGLKGSPDHWPESPFALSSKLSWKDAKIQGCQGEARLLSLQYDPKDKAVPALLTYDWAPPSDLKPAHIVSANLHPLDKKVSTDNQILAFKGVFNLLEKNYRLALVADLPKKQITHLQPLLARHQLSDFPLSHLEAQFTSTGELTSEGKHQGQVKITNSLLEHPSGKFPPTRIQGTLGYDHEKNLTFKDVHLEQKDLHLHSNGSYAKDRLNLTKLTLDKTILGTGNQPAKAHTKNLLTATLRTPLSSTVRGLESFIEQKGDLAVYLEAKELPIAELESLIQTPLPLTGVLDTTLTVRGTLKEPTLRGDITVTDLLLKDQQDIPRSDLTITLDAQNNAFNITGTLSPDDQPDITLTGQTTFRPWHWAQNPQDLLNEPLFVRALCKTLPLAPFLSNVEALDEFDATAHIDLTVNGTMSKPTFQGQASVDLHLLQLKDIDLPPITDTRLQLDFDDSLITVSPVSISLLGGRYQSSGTIDITDLKNPGFDLAIQADQALLWRNESFSSRANTQARLQGTLEKAKLSGNIDIIETLYYKAIEILPIGVSTRTRKAPKLPNFSRKDKSNTFPVPAPFDKWELDITTRTADPILIRSNLATSDISGSIHFTGTLSNPLANGALKLSDTEATLPFSRLKIAKGQVRFTGDNILNPKIEVRGTSRVNSYDVNLNISGSVNKSQTTLSTNPPLPEHEILSLIATGVTTTGLEDQETASTKALQLLLEKLRRSPPGGQGTPLARFLKETRDLELRVAETSTFTGRKFSSASFPLHERWHVSAAVDEDRSTRGLIIYVLRFH